jgi:hypothetical protein
VGILRGCKLEVKWAENQNKRLLEARSLKKFGKDRHGHREVTSTRS